MRLHLKMNLMVFFIITIIFSSSVVMADKAITQVDKRQLDNKESKWRIGFCESEPFSNYTGTLHGLISGLAESGWITVNIEDMPYTEGQEDSFVMWQWLSNQDVGPYIEFVEDAYYSINERDQLDSFHESITNDKKDLDLLIVMGTYAGKVASNAEHSIPTMVFSSSNAVQSGIIKSVEDSGKDHLWAHMDSERYIRQIQVFHDIFKFKKLGIVYENSPVGRIYAAIDDLKMLSKGLGFELVAYIVEEAKNEEDSDRYHKEVRKAHEALAKEVDAMYITAGTRNIDTLNWLMEPFYDAGVPVFSQLGENEVRHGALLSLYRADFLGLGHFGADQIIKVLEGIKPRDLPQVYGDIPSIVLNMKVAEKTGYKPPFEILLIADKIYHNIEGK